MRGEGSELRNGAMRILEMKCLIRGNARSKSSRRRRQLPPYERVGHYAPHDRIGDVEHEAGHPLSVAFVSQAADRVLPPVQNSIGTCTYELARHLADRGCAVTVFALARDG